MTDIHLKKYRGLILIAVLAILADFFVTGKLAVLYSTDAVTVKGGLINARIAYSEVVSVSWRNGFRLGARVSGVNTLGYYAGEFQGGDLDRPYELFLDRNYDGEVLIITTGELTAVVGSSSFDLRELYDTLCRQGQGEPGTDLRGEGEENHV